MSESMSSVIDPFGIFKQLIEETAEKVLAECGSLAKKMIILSDQNEVAFVNWVDDPSQLLEGLQDKIRAMAFIQPLDGDKIRIRVIDYRTKYGIVYAKQSDNKLLETNEHVSFEDIEKFCTLLEEANAEKEQQP